MMKRITAGASVLLASAAVAWMGGYDFDYRSGGVAVWAGVTLIWAVLAASYPGWSDQ